MTGKRVRDARSRSTVAIGPADVDAWLGEWGTAAVRARFAGVLTGLELGQLSVGTPMGKQQVDDDSAVGCDGLIVRSARWRPWVCGSA
jgi:hypothetical protein